MGAIKAGIFRETMRKFLRRQGAAASSGVSVGERDLLPSNDDMHSVRLSEGVHSLPVEDAAGPNCVEDAVSYLNGVYGPLPNDDWAKMYCELGGEG